MGINIIKIEKPELCFNAIRATPYLTGLASELFMKGYLIYKGEKTHKVRKLNHSLRNLRLRCIKFGDSRFGDRNLKFLTDTCGEHLMEDGGIRYPDKHEMPIFLSQFKKALEILQKISSDVSDQLMNKNNQK